MSSVQVSSVALLQVSDQISRNQSSYGVLVGKKGEDIAIARALPLKLNKTLVDWNHLHKHLTLTKTSLPQYELIGVYHINDDTTVTEEALQVFEQFVSSLPSIYAVFTPSSEVASFDFNTQTPLHTIINASLVESIATNSIANHRQYAEDAVLGDSEGLVISVDQLEKKVRAIVARLDAGDYSQEQLNKVVLLANKVEAFKRLNHPAEDPLLLYATNLALLTTQLNSLDHLKSQIKKNIVRYGMNSRSLASDTFETYHD